MLTKDNTWRVRLGVINFLPTLPSHISRDTFNLKIEPLILGFLEDTVFGVRMEVVKMMIRLKEEQFKIDWLEQIVEKKLEELYKH